MAGKDAKRNPAKNKPAKNSSAKRSRIGAVFYWGLVVALWGGIGLSGLIFYYALDMPDTDGLWSVSRSPEVRVYARDDAALSQRGRNNGAPLRYDDLPSHLVQAVVAIEDRRFFSHYGLDPRGLARAMFANLRAGRFVQGGSTLTQQLAKNVFLTPDRTFKRKVQELLLAFWMEARLSKQEIMALYFNRVYFGAGAYGVQAAAQTYFARPAQELTLPEAAILAGLLKAPSRYAPTRDPEAAVLRARQVLKAMTQTGYLAQAQADNITFEALRVSRQNGASAHYAVDWALEQLPGFIGRPRSDIDVITTIDPAMQQAAENALNAVLTRDGAARAAGQAAVVVMTPDGAVRAIVGGRSYAKSQFNRAVQANRQPGSAFKPLVYLAGLESGLSPDQQFTDAPFSVEDWTPRNYSEVYEGEVTMARALAKSLNTVAVQVSEQAGRARVIEIARRLGITSRLRPHPSIALGSFEVSLLELTAAYAHFANGGYQTFPYIINAAITKSGTILYERTAPAPPRVIAAGDVAAMNNMLMRTIEDGTGRRAAISGQMLAGKTGTSQNWRDAWFVGYSGALVVGVWVGNDDGAPMNKVTGSGLPAQIWRQFMTTQPAQTSLPGLGNGAGGETGLLDWILGN
ncbi:MAG: Penicillin-binding protein 2D [Rhodobiaceae bacterium UBA7378]|nr:MAG: Penicillin-binding protein 2D [Rhodobiaceae bacterium UBA7378]